MVYSQVHCTMNVVYGRSVRGCSQTDCTSDVEKTRSASGLLTNRLHFERCER